MNTISRITAIILIMLMQACSATQAVSVSMSAKPESSVKIATVHFCPKLGDVEVNTQRLSELTEQAAKNCAKIIVHTEMAVSGYSFFSRSEIARVAETIPGAITNRFGKISKQYGIYVVVGMPEYDPESNLFFNSAALIGPDGNVVGKYRKHNNLLEASYNAEVLTAVPTFRTPYGRVGIVICADLLYSQFPRLAAISGADILLAPANVGITTDFLRVRAYENDFAIVVANRFGTEIKGSEKDIFTQESFTIPSPWAYDFSYDSRSVIMTRTGDALADISEPADTIGYADLPITTSKRFPVSRRPKLYSLIAQDTLEPYTFKQLGLPAPAIFAATAVDPGPSQTPWETAITSMRNALTAAGSGGRVLKIIVLPASHFQEPDPEGIRKFQEFSRVNNVDIVASFGKTVPPTSQLITPSCEIYTYARTHKGCDESIPENKLSDYFFIADRSYGRLALLHDKDMFAPETAMVMAKMGVDIIAVSAASPESFLSALWQSRTCNYLHIVVANLHGKEGVYLGGYKAYPSYEEAEGMVIMNMNTSDVREKKEPRFLDFNPLLNIGNPQH